MLCKADIKYHRSFQDWSACASSTQNAFYLLDGTYSYKLIALFDSPKIFRAGRLGLDLLAFGIDV
jgi:hypothetical protein